MATIFIIHGVCGHPGENWFPWLKKELETLGHQVFVPQFPTPENQTLENWKKIFKDYENYMNEDSVVVGHSLGAAFLLRILEERYKAIRGAFFVAGVTGSVNNPFFDNINQTFLEKPFNWGEIIKNCESFYLFHSDNDPYLPAKEAERLAENLGTTSKFVQNAGHFNEKAGYLKFDLLLNKINREFIK